MKRTGTRQARRKAGLWMLTLILALSLGALGLSACGGPSSANSGGGEGDVYTFKLDTPDSIDSITGSFLSAWADEVREASGGRIDIKVYPNGQLGAVPDIINNLKSGVSDIAWGSPAMFSGTFPVTEGTNFPMLDIPSSKAGTDLLWDLYEKTDLMQKEYEGLHVLMLTNCCPYYFASGKGDKPINTVDDLKGMKVRTQGTYPSILMTALGAEPISQHASEIYESMSKGVLDAMLTDVTTFKTYKLSEVTGHVVETQIYRFCGFILMNPDSYATLPDDLKKILDERSGRETSYAFGDAWEAGAEEGVALYKDAGATTSTFSDADLAKISDAAAVARDKWISDMDSMGYEGQAVYDKYVELLSAINGAA